MKIIPAFTLAGILMCSTVAAAEPPDLVYLGDFAGGIVYSYATDINGDGTQIVGRSFSASGAEAFIWNTGAGMVNLGDLPGGSYSAFANNVSSDGHAVVGNSSSASGTEAFYWTSGGGMIGLGDFAGGIFSSSATGIDGSGTIVVGFGFKAAGTEAFRWTSGTGMVGLGDLPGGGDSSTATAISTDGNVIVGYGTTASGLEAFRWTSGTGMVGIGDLPGGIISSQANAVNSDGSVIVGLSSSASGTEAFRWTSGTGMVGLGDLPDGAYNSSAKAVSANGAIVVGQGASASGTAAFIWDQTNGIRELATVLADLGVDLTGWTALRSANGVSDNGERIVGYGTYLGNTAAFLAIVSNNLTSGGLTTPDALAESLTEAPVSHQQAISQNGIYASRGLFLARNALAYFPKVVAQQHNTLTGSSPSLIEPAAGIANHRASRYLSPDQWAFYSLGSFAMGQENNPDSHAVDGSIGVLYRADRNWILGGGMISGQTSIDLGNGGTNILDSYGGEILSSYQHPNGIRLYVIGFASYLTLDSSRGYMNGGGRSYSYGESEGYGYGASARLGYEIDVLPERGFTATPYIETEYSKTHLDHYNEQHGPFPASYSDQDGERVIGRAGVELSHDVGETVTVRGRAAYARRLYDAKDQVTASSTGLTLTLSPDAVDDQWGEGGVSVLWQADENVHVSADLSGRTGKTEDPYARATLGLTVGF